ncbi:MAG: aspartyl/asparaginyl beta-hydroxylase domain-containing protein [Rhizomicrobium sp.]
MARIRFDRDLIISAGQRALPAFDRLLMRFNAAGEHQVFPNADFGWTSYLEANCGRIRSEAQNLMRDRMSVPSLRDISPDHDKIAVDEKWRSFFLWAYGVRIGHNCARCPETAALLEHIPGLLSAFYSVMLSGAHVPRHTGPTKAILTAHLGLIVPLRRELCRMVIGDHEVVWEQGRIVIFDDMYPHEVWNDTDEDRVILLLHLKRPLRFPGSALRDLFFAALRLSPFVQDGLRNLDRWEQAKAAPGAALSVSSPS